MSRSEFRGSQRPAPTRALLSAHRHGVPELPSPHVRRPRLLAALDRSPGAPLTLVSAPAGTGKTTLVAEWARRLVLRAPVGWVTFEDGDGSLWLDLVSCLDRLGVAVPDLSTESGAYAAPSRAQLSDLAAGVAATPHRVTVVLDGYELTAPDEARALHHLLERSGGRLGLVLVTRLDPVLPLYRYRLEGSLVEVRLADLAFTDAEAAALLHGSGVDLDPPVVHAVNDRVRGWAAGLRFAARALQVHEDPAAPAASVSAVEQATDINEYLLGEVLDVQTPEARRFLLETSVADVLTTPLVVELCGPEAEHLLATLPHLNTFTEPVPGRPGCLSYPPFFKSLLQAQLAYEEPQKWLELHRRAAQWCLGEGLPDRALTHLSAGHAWVDVARLLVSSGRVGPLVSEGPLAGASWAAATRIPPDLDLPEACVVRASVALAEGDTHTCSVELAGARAWLAAARPPGVSAPALDAALAVVDAVRAGLTGTAQDAERLATAAGATLERARRTTPAVGRAGLVALAGRCRGVAALRRGDTRTARSLLLHALSPTERQAPTEPGSAEAPGDEVSAGLRADILGHLAVVDSVEGHLARATRTAEAALALADGVRPGAVCHGEAAAHVALAAVALDRCHPKDARQQVATALAMPSLRAHPVCRALAETALAGVERAAGDLPRALDRLDAAAEAAATADPWLADGLRLESARLGLASGRTEVTAHALGSLADPDAPEAAAVAATALIEQGCFAAADDRLALLRHRSSGPRSEVVGLLADGARRLHDSAPGRARAALDRSLRLAAPEGLRRPFRDAGPAVQQLLRDRPSVLHEHPWLGAGTASRNEGSEPAAAPPSERMLEELTAKELEVLGHLEELLTTEEIAAHMFISVNTVRTHVRNVLRKLDVNRRNAAVRRARELDLLPDPVDAPRNERIRRPVQHPADAS